MTSFLNELATAVKIAVDRGDTIERITAMIESMEARILQSQEIHIDLRRRISNDGASMMAICSILKYSLAYWTAFEEGNHKRSEGRYGEWKNKKSASRCLGICFSMGKQW